MQNRPRAKSEPPRSRSNSENDISEIEARGDESIYGSIYASTPTSDNDKGVLDNSPDIHMNSWTNYPSHTRASRISTAPRAADAVAIRDFAAERSGWVSSADEKKKKNQSTNLIKRAKKACDYSKFNFRRRTSLSYVKPLEYPELERLPKDPLFHPKLPRGVDPDAPLKDPYGRHSIGSIANLQLMEGQGKEPFPHRPTSQHAKKHWPRLNVYPYDGNDGEKTPATTTESAATGPEHLPAFLGTSKPRVRLSRASEGAANMGLRWSLQEDEDEAQADEKALQIIAEQSLNCGVSDLLLD